MPIVLCHNERFIYFSAIPWYPRHCLLEAKRREINNELAETKGNPVRVTYPQIGLKTAEIGV